jgi:peptidoglycan L-alanyl-D-glutamate endopeptidase CwlK
MTTLHHSVGRNGTNERADVVTVQELLHEAGLYPKHPDGIVGPKTINAIVSFQQRYLSLPDGVVEPGKLTFRKLLEAAEKHPAMPARDPTGPSDKWAGDSSKWSQEKKLDSMNSAMRAKVVDLLERLRKQGFQPKIFFGWRSVEVQKKLVEEGNSTVTFSFHNAQLPDGTPNAYAADIVDQRWGWSDAAQQNGYWDALGKTAHDVGLYWGGDWKTFKDWAHVQLYPNSDLARVKKESGL